VSEPGLDERRHHAAGGTGLPPVHSLYQPIVDLRTGATVAFEALARGPEGSEWESPAALFALAGRDGREEALDFECQAAAMTGAVNAEPRWLGLAPPPHLRAVIDQATARLQVVVEITERSLVHDPAALLEAVRRIRAAGWGVALDDVGADPASLALMPFIEPDVIKLDLRLVQDNTNAEIAGIVNAVMAQAERSGALILAEGIETAEHRDRALAMGATLGQGWMLGRPAPLPPDPAVPRSDLGFTRAQRGWPTTPYELIRSLKTVRTTTKGMLLPLSHHLERHAMRAGEPPVLLATFEDAHHFTAGTAARYRALAQRCAFTGALGAGMKAIAVEGVRGADLDAEDQLAGEWVVCVVGPHFSGALIAKDLGDDGPDRERRFEFAITYDRDLVLAAAGSMFSRIAPL
jgi:EAL domain-containing protein (putative c-di-GMP-specific phosphodiesterase class I)